MSERPQYTCVVCRKPIAPDFDNVGVQAVVHVYDLSKGWPHEQDGHRGILQAHEGDCAARLLTHLAHLESSGIP